MKKNENYKNDNKIFIINEKNKKNIDIKKDLLSNNQSLLNNDKKSKKEKKDNYFNSLFKNFNFKKHTFSVIFITLILLSVSTLSVYLGGGFYTSKTIIASENMIRITQAKLSEMGYYYNDINGVLNSSTEEAITNFQSDHGLLKTGELNEATTTALGVSTNEQTNSELYLLAKLIYSEARGEIYTGQVAVGAVVLNRVDNAGFPNTLEGVIYQPWAFTALHDGQFNLEPTATTYQAAQDALNGWDPSYGSLYYYNPSTATSSWIFSRTTIVVIGNHVFAI